MKCPKCGRNAASGVEVCPGCGTILLLPEQTKKIRTIAIIAICLGIAALVFNGIALIVARTVSVPPALPVLILSILAIGCGLGGAGCGIVAFVTGLVKKSVRTWLIGLLSLLLGIAGIALGIVNLLVATLAFSGIYNGLV